MYWLKRWNFLKRNHPNIVEVKYKKSFLDCVNIITIFKMSTPTEIVKNRTLDNLTFLVQFIVYTRFTPTHWHVKMQQWKFWWTHTTVEHLYGIHEICETKQILCCLFLVWKVLYIFSDSTVVCEWEGKTWLHIVFKTLSVCV